MSRFLAYLRILFNLHRDSVAPGVVIGEITAGIRFRGKNLWILIFAIFMASLGLNVNSTAVIIGAMLISPLMGPIMGIGLGLGINDLQLLKDAARNYLIAVLIGLLTSTLYFSISPVTGNPSELLARTTPTVYDVLIALFGGLAGIVAANSKDNRGNVIPGVAIATALMPPLCTAGFGLSQGNLYFFLGAFYLLFINTVFICLATYLIVRILKYPFHIDPDPKRQVRIRQLITTITVLTVIPSILLGYRMINQDIFERNAERFIREAVVFPGTIVINKTIRFDRKRIAVSLLGRRVEEPELNQARSKLDAYRLKGVTLDFDQGLSDSVRNASGLKRQFDLISMLDKRIGSLEDRVQQPAPQPADTVLLAELKALFPTMTKVGVTLTPVNDLSTETADTAVIGIFAFSKPVTTGVRRQLEAWLKARFRTDHAEIIISK